MPQKPSLKDVFRPPPRAGDPTPLIRHHGQSLRSRDPGYLDGRFATPQPVLPGPSLLVGGDEGGGDTDEASVVGEDGDRLVLTSLGTQPWALSYLPVAETIHVRFHPAGGAGIPWLRGDQWEIDDDSNVIVVSAETLAAAKAQLGQGDFLSAQYLRLEGEQEAPSDTTLDALVLRGATGPADHPATLALPDGSDPDEEPTQVGDLIVVAFATMHFTGAEGTATVSDTRLTRVGHGAWIGIATDLSPVTFTNPGGDLYTAAVATFRQPAFYKNDADVGPTAGGNVTVDAPVVAAAGAVLVVTVDNPNSLDSTVDAVPAGYVVAAGPNQGSLVCKAGIYYWVDGTAAASPSGNITYTAVHGHAYATTIGLQGDEV